MSERREGPLADLLHRPQPSWLQLLYASPIITLARTLYSFRSQCLSIRPPKTANPVTVVCVSDTHNQFPEVPEGDILIHAGDLSQGGTGPEIQRTLDWLAGLPHSFKIVIAGNHDLLLDPQKITVAEERLTLNWHDLIYLQDSAESLSLKGGRILNIFGSPWTRRHGSWAFQYPDGHDQWTKTVPEETDILVTHMPPFGHLDHNRLGDRRLLCELRRVRPRLHVFGHIHAGYGDESLHYDAFEATYEAVMDRQVGLVGLFKMAWHLLGISVTRRNRPSLCYTTLVNAASVGGARDSELRAPIIVTI